MVDFLLVSTRSTKKGWEIYPKFIIKKSNDLMIRGGDFYAIWLEDKGLWSTDESDAIQLIDKELDQFAEEHKAAFDGNVRVLHLWDSENRMIERWHTFCKKDMRDSFHMLDETIIFSDMEVDKKNYASKRLEYPLQPCKTPSYDSLMNTLYSPEERHKIEWCIGSIVCGDSKKLQKFMVLYGAAGTGKSTILNIIQMLFEGYYSVFDAKALGSSSNSFALEAFKTNPLIAIQHDGDLSRIEDNTRLNSLVSHELMTVNEKFKATYANRFKAFLFMGTNKPVRITDSKSGLIRRLIDVSPTGNKVPASEYKTLMKNIPFELGGIACHCMDVYQENTSYYDGYVPIAMMGASNDFYNFVEDSSFTFKREDCTTLHIAWEMYKSYCEDAKVPYPMPQRVFREELKAYWTDFYERYTLEDGNRIRNYYAGFREDLLEGFDKTRSQKKPDGKKLINFLNQPSILDKDLADCPAQLATRSETPSKKWAEVTTKLSDIDTSKVHYVKPYGNHIVIDFDIPGEDGKKSFDKNLEEASKWPPTYAELSKSGAGIHLHYIYDGDVSTLSPLYAEHIEIKTFLGGSSLRRKLTKCNDIPIATLSSGLPQKGAKKVVNFDTVKSEKGLRSLIIRNLKKEIHSGTKPSVEFIKKILDEAYEGGLHYDVRDMENDILVFAASSTNHSGLCLDMVSSMHLCSDDISDSIANDDSPIAFYDVEVFPNLFLVNYKLQGEGKSVIRLINPKPADIEAMLKYRLVGFNCRRYDNHMLYACMMGYSNQGLYDLSQKIVSGAAGGFFGEAYNISYTDVYDFAAKKQSLKKWEIELGLHHYELGLPWDEPVPEDKWEKVAEYCDWDVISTEVVFDHLAGDFTARKILAALAGGTVNDTTNSLTTKIIFGKERHPQLVYTDLATGKQDPPQKDNGLIMGFPGYSFDEGKNIYRDTDVGKGGYVYANPGMYGNVALLDVASMHPASIMAMNQFGEYTQKFKDIRDARVHIKHKDFDKARKMLDGKLAPFLDDEDNAANLAQALKIAINSVYGLTAASFDNPFRDHRNMNNITALRGALFMRTLQDEVASKGYTVVHIKTDSIKIADATPEIIKFVMDFGEKYGYTFEHEATYDRICLVNDAVYIAKYSDNTDINGKHAGEWTATGAEFQHPFIFKTLFSKEEVDFYDLCETKSVAKGAIHLDFNETLPEGEHDYHFVGKVGQFTPIQEASGGALLVCINGEKIGAVTGTKGYRWLESEFVRDADKFNDIDMGFYHAMADAARNHIDEYGQGFDWFVSDEPYIGPEYHKPDGADIPIPMYAGFL